MFHRLLCYSWLFVMHNFQSQLAGWTKWNICLSKNRTLLNLIARKMTMSIICEIIVFGSYGSC
ncbi:hypothetical protein Hanom_Chr17g01558281 [Helianthus anomalus]